MAAEIQPLFFQLFKTLSIREMRGAFKGHMFGEMRETALLFCFL